jgi:hypothetical protein
MNEAFCIRCHGPMNQTSDGHLLCNNATCPNSHLELPQVEKAQAPSTNGKGWP